MPALQAIPRVGPYDPRDGGPTSKSPLPNLHDGIDLRHRYYENDKLNKKPHRQVPTLVEPGRDVKNVKAII